MSRPTLADLCLEWHAVMVERRAIPSPSSIRQCEEQDERSEGPCYVRGALCVANACDPCRERLARFNRIKSIAGRLRGIETRMFNEAARVKEGKK